MRVHNSWFLMLAVLHVCVCGCEVSTVTDVTPAKLELSDVLKDDKLDDKHPVFDEALVDSRTHGDWSINSSAAVLKIDTPLIRPDYSPEQTKLYPSYKAAQVLAGYGEFIPSVSMLDTKSKQFDDGLYAALDQAYYQGLQDRLVSHVALIRRIFDKCKPESQAAAYLAAGLSIAGIDAPASDGKLKESYLTRFNNDPIASKPISFYEWNNTLKSCWRFMRFFQQPLSAQSDEIQEIAAVLQSDPSMRDDYQHMIDFYSKLTNPLSRKHLLNFSSSDREVSLVPPSSSRENELFASLYPEGLPADANLMRDLITRIKSGQIDLAPNKDSGWYDYQVFALESFLLPERSAEHDKLLLTKEYKQRLIQAFQATITSHREIHARQEMAQVSAYARPRMKTITPRLRVEPSPTFYLRTARAYAFLQKFLNESIGNQTLAGLHGLTAEGQRPQTLSDELEAIKALFYGMYLVSCEDIGLQASLNEREIVDSKVFYDQALQWLAQCWDDPDITVDRRISIPILNDAKRQVTRLWMIVGVRLVKLEASYAIAPMVRVTNEAESKWELVPEEKLEPQSVLIAVDEFAEVELKGNVSLTRRELREICDRCKSKEEILRALQAR